MAKTDFVNTATDGTEVELEVVTYKYDQGNNKWKAYRQGSADVDLSTAVTWNTVNGKNALEGPIYLSSMSTNPSPEGATPGTGAIVVPSGATAIMPADYWIWSNDNKQAALIIDIPCTFTNNGNIIGKGGAGNLQPGTFLYGGSSAEPTIYAEMHGGPALSITAASDVTINNEAGAYIAGGGGGGWGSRSGAGAGGGDYLSYDRNTAIFTVISAGGAINSNGNAGNASGNKNVSSFVVTAAGAGGGGGGSFTYNSGSYGAVTGGSGGRVLPGTGGASSGPGLLSSAADGGGPAGPGKPHQLGATYSEGNPGSWGGGGGGWGAAGGAQTSSGNTGTSAAASGNGDPGGNGGAAITGNAYTQGTWDGTVYGAS